MAYDKDLVFNDGASAVTASGNSSALDIGPIVNPLTVDVVCTAKSGTNPTLDVNIQGSDNNSTWVTFGSFPQMTATGESRRKALVPYRYYRLNYVLGGTNPSFTFKAAITFGGRDTKIG